MDVTDQNQRPRFQQHLIARMTSTTCNRKERISNKLFKLATYFLLTLNVVTYFASAAMGLPDGIDNILGFVPKSNFKCEREGYFGDVDNDCRIFHLCQRQVHLGGQVEWRHWTYACGNQTMFNQLTLTCAFIDEAIPCRHASQFQYLNEVIHKPSEPFLTDADVTSGISYYNNRLLSDGARARAFEDSTLMAQIGGSGQVTSAPQPETINDQPSFNGEDDASSRSITTVDSSAEIPRSAGHSATIARQQLQSQPLMQLRQINSRSEVVLDNRGDTRFSQPAFTSFNSAQQFGPSSSFAFIESPRSSFPTAPQSLQRLPQQQQDLRLEQVQPQIQSLPQRSQRQEIPQQPRRQQQQLPQFLPSQQESQQFQPQTQPQQQVAPQFSQSELLPPLPGNSFGFTIETNHQSGSDPSFVVSNRQFVPITTTVADAPSPATAPSTSTENFQDSFTNGAGDQNQTPSPVITTTTTTVDDTTTVQPQTGSLVPTVGPFEPTTPVVVVPVARSRQPLRRAQTIATPLPITTTTSNQLLAPGTQPSADLFIVPAIRTSSQRSLAPVAVTTTTARALTTTTAVQPTTGTVAPVELTPRQQQARRSNNQLRHRNLQDDLVFDGVHRAFQSTRLSSQQASMNANGEGRSRRSESALVMRPTASITTSRAAATQGAGRELRQAAGRSSVVDSEFWRQPFRVQFLSLPSTRLAIRK